MTNLDADKVFFESAELRRTCLGGAPFEYVLICTRTGDFEVWSSIENGKGRCLAGGGYYGPSKITIGELVVFETTPDEWSAAVERGDVG